MLGFKLIHISKGGYRYIPLAQEENENIIVKQCG